MCIWSLVDFGNHNEQRGSGGADRGSLEDLDILRGGGNIITEQLLIRRGGRKKHGHLPTQHPVALKQS